MAAKGAVIGAAVGAVVEVVVGAEVFDAVTGAVVVDAVRGTVVVDAVTGTVVVVTANEWCGGPDFASAYANTRPTVIKKSNSAETATGHVLGFRDEVIFALRLSQRLDTNFPKQRYEQAKAMAQILTCRTELLGALRTAGGYESGHTRHPGGVHLPTMVHRSVTCCTSPIASVTVTTTVVV